MLFRDRPVALVLVHHVAKASHDDFVAQVSGTYGVSGSVDTIIDIDRKRVEAFGTINVTGRDIEDGRLSVRFDDMALERGAGGPGGGSFAARRGLPRSSETSGPPLRQAASPTVPRTWSGPRVQHMVERLVAAGAVQRVSTGYAVAGVSLTIPNHSLHPKSDMSDGGETRVRAREDEPPWPDSPPSDLSLDDEDLMTAGLAIFGDMLPRAVA